MSFSQHFAAEWGYELGNTRKMIEISPEDKFGWKPHDKSSSLGELVKHLAELLNCTKIIITESEIDFAKLEPVMSKATFTKAEVLEVFDKLNAEGLQIISGASDASYEEMFQMKVGGNPIAPPMPRHISFRNIQMNHLIHHRGQLSVYLRLLNVPLPGVYGPTADDTMGM